MSGEHIDLDVEELLGAYALDAVDEDERERVERHLADCPRCRLEVEQHREVAAQLAYVGAPAPDGVWDRVVASLEDAPPALDLAPVVPLAPRPVRRSLVVTGAALVAAAAAVIGLLGLRVSRLDDRLSALAARQRQDPMAQQIDGAVATPGATRVSLRGQGQAGVEAVLLPDGTGYLIRSSLPALPAGRTYQLWAIAGSDKVSLGVLGSQPGESQFQIVGAHVDALAVTNEVAGGVVAPSLPPVVLGYVSRA
jgi:hypothetical protein